jgi:hypothetical protein
MNKMRIIVWVSPFQYGFVAQVYALFTPIFSALSSTNILTFSIKQIKLLYLSNGKQKRVATVI